MGQRSHKCHISQFTLRRTFDPFDSHDFFEPFETKNKKASTFMNANFYLLSIRLLSSFALLGMTRTMRPSRDNVCIFSLNRKDKDHSSRSLDLP